MIVGADDAKDADIVRSSVALYSGYKLKRVYYSAYSPDPGIERRAAGAYGAPDARAPHLSGRLAVSILRVLSRRHRRRDRRRHARPDDRPEARLGAEAPADLSDRRQHGVARASAARSRPWREERQAHPADSAAMARWTSPASGASRGRSRRCGASVATRDWHPGTALDSAHLAQAVRPPERQMSLF